MQELGFLEIALKQQKTDAGRHVTAILRLADETRDLAAAIHE